MKIAKWIYRLLWVVVIVLLALLLPAWQAVGVAGLVASLVFMKTVTTIGEVMSQVSHIQTLAGQMVNAYRLEVEAIRKELEVARSKA